MVFCGDIAQPFVDASGFLLPESLTHLVWVGNLEGSLVEGKDSNGVYNEYNAIESLCRKIPFKAFSIANNHLLDAADVEISLDNIARLGKVSVGAGNNLSEAARQLSIKDADGLEYIVLAFGWESIQCHVATNSDQGVNPYTRDNVMSHVSNALEIGAPVICFLHWDYELERYPQPYDRHLAHELIDMGVAAVIGCHAHRVQPVEFYKGKPIVYGLGNFLFYQGHYFDGKLKFPKFCEIEYAFEINNGGYKLHHFHYDQQDNRLVFSKTEEISPLTEFDGKAEFTGFSDKEYEEWFRKHRVQKKLLPIFYAKENAFSYWMKTEWIKVRGGLINVLTSMNLKSRNRANR